MKYMILYQYEGRNKKYIVGFANSLEEFIEHNERRSFPYNFKKENLSVYELHTDVFNPATVSEESNLQDYLR